MSCLITVEGRQVMKFPTRGATWFLFHTHKLVWLNIASANRVHGHINSLDMGLKVDSWSILWNFLLWLELHMKWCLLWKYQYYYYYCRGFCLLRSCSVSFYCWLSKTGYTITYCAFTYPSNQTYALAGKCIDLHCFPFMKIVMQLKLFKIIAISLYFIFTYLSFYLPTARDWMCDV